MQEPELLRVDAERIRRQMQEVAVNNYRAFISAADALLAIREEVSSVDKHLESLVIIVFVSVGFYFFIFLLLKFDVCLSMKKKPMFGCLMMLDCYFGFDW